MKKTIKMILCLAMALCLFTGCTVVNVAKAGSVNGEDIPLGVYKYSLKIAEMYFGHMDYEDKLTNVAMYDNYTASFVYGAIADIMAEAGEAEEGKSIWDKAYGETTVGEAVKNALFDEIAKVYIAAEKAAEKEITLTEEEINAVSTMKSNLYGVVGSKTSFDEALGKINLTSNQLGELWNKVLLSAKLAESITAEKDATEEEIENYFNDNYLRVKHILIKTGDGGEATMEDAKTKAEAILAKLAAGEDFEALMNAESDDVDAEGKVNGGEEGYIFKEGDFGNPAFEDASKALAAGEYTTELVEVNGASYSGYHIIKRYEIPAGYFAENKEALSETIKTVIGNEAYDAEIDAAFAEANVVKSESKIKSIKLTVIEAE